MKVLLANPRGFCAGVDRAIDIVERAIELFGAPIYVRHEVVHNKFVVDRLRGLGAVFVDELDAVPDGATVIFSAHGVPSRVEQEAGRRGLTVFDATCPLVTKVHMEVGQLRARRARRDPDRPRRPPGGGGHHGPLRREPGRAHPPGRDRGRCREARRARPGEARRRDADDALGRRHGEGDDGAARSASRRSRRRARKTSATRRRTARTR